MYVSSWQICTDVMVSSQLGTFCEGWLLKNTTCDAYIFTDLFVINSTVSIQYLHTEGIILTIFQMNAWQITFVSFQFAVILIVSIACNRWIRLAN
jgi:hypothetical protein